MKSTLVTIAVALAMSFGMAAAADRSAVKTGLDDSAITAKVKAELVRDPATKAHQIEVKTDNGVVQLSGFVDSLSAKNKAEDDARTVEGVQSVSNGLEVRAAERTAGRAIDDAALTNKVKAALIEDPVTKARQIDVTTNGGVVQLSGFVDTQEQKSKAADVARSVAGVKEVQNNLDIKTKRM